MTMLQLTVFQGSSGMFTVMLYPRYRAKYCSTTLKTSAEEDLGGRTTARMDITEGIHFLDNSREVRDQRYMVMGTAL